LSSGPQLLRVLGKDITELPFNSELRQFCVINIPYI
jgi:hypothetical protein